jgi:hypothetical protein
MAISIRTNPAGVPVYPDSYSQQNDLQQATQRGHSRVGLDSYADGSTAPEVVTGSEFEIDGDIVRVITANEAISGVGAIANSNDIYVYYDPTAEEFVASTTAPTFSVSLGGWYNGSDRALFKMYKDSSGDYVERNILEDFENKEQIGNKKINGGLIVSGISSIPEFSGGLSHVDIRGTYSTFGSTTATVVLPKGLLHLTVSNTSGTTNLEIKDISGTWQIVGQASSASPRMSSLVMSDGANIRLTSGTYFYSYMKIGE